VCDSTVKTGNDALDTILTEKSLLGEREGIDLSCIADGKALSFMNPAEIYSLFGNAIENAMDAVTQLEDPEQRVVSLAVRRVAGMVSIHMENRCPKEVKFEDGCRRQARPMSRTMGLVSSRCSWWSSATEARSLRTQTVRRSSSTCSSPSPDWQASLVEHYYPVSLCQMEHYYRVSLFQDPRRAAPTLPG